ncbi:MAG: ATP-grasp domain-containing protein [Anaerovoracaceae bacterium]
MKTNSIKNNFSVVVLSRNHSTGLSVIRSLGEAGYSVDLIASAKREGQSKLACLSKYVRTYVEIVSDKVDRDGDKEIIAELLKYKGSDNSLVLIPTDDYTASVVDNNKNILKEIFVVPEVVGSKAGELTRLMNKSVQAEIARNAGFITPKEWVVSLRDEDIYIPEDVEFPCFCKPPESIVGYKTEMARCENLEELKKHLHKMRENYAGRDFLVQEFLDIDCEYELDGLCIDQTVIVPAVSENHIVGEFDKGVPTFGELHPFEVLGEAKEKTLKVLQELHYFGLFDMQVFKVGDKYYFNEINIRSGGPIYAYTASGANLPKIFVQEALGYGHDAEDEKVDGFGKKYFYEKIGWNDYFHGNMTLDEVKKCEAGADIFFIYDEEDSEPESVFRASIEKKLAVKEEKEKCILATMAATGLDYETAEKAVVKRRADIGIRYKNYKKYNFHLIPERKLKEKREELRVKYRQAKTQKERDAISVIDKSDIHIVVLSRGYATGISVARSLGTEGYTVDMIASVRKKGMAEIAARSKYVRNFTEVIAKKMNDYGEEKVIDALMSLGNEGEIKPILFPTDDYSVSIVDEARNLLNKKFNMPFVSDDKSDSLLERMNKSYQSTLAKEAGIPVPKEWVIDLSSDEPLPGDIEYPIFCKPVESISGFKQEMTKCENEEELIDRINRMKGRNPNRSVLVQEFLSIDTEIDFSGVCIDQKIIIPAIIRKTAVAQYEKGVTLAGVLKPFEEMGDLQEKIVDMLRKFHYTGMFDMELNVVGDKVFFNEVNLRSGGPNYSYFASGVNLPDIFVKAILHMDYTEKETQVDEYGKSFIYEKVAWEDYTAGLISKRQLNKYIKQADITLLYNDDDPEPGIQFREISGTKAKKKRKAKKKEAYLGDIIRKLRDVNSIRMGYPQTKKENARNPESQFPRIMVAGRNYCTNLGIARSLGEAGYEVEVMRVYQKKPEKGSLHKELKPDAYSKYIKGYYICVSGYRNERIVKKLKELADPDRKMLIIPGDDLVASVIDTFGHELEDFYIMPNIKGHHGEIMKHMSKELQTELARKIGLPVLNSHKIQTINRKFDLPEGLTFPCFVKPNISVENPKATMKKCSNEEELREHFDFITEKKDRTMLVEDYVEIKNEYSILGVGTREGAIGPALFIAEKGGQGRRRGVAVTGRIIPIERLQPLADKLVAFVESIGFEGLYDIDLIETVDGKIYFAEMNMRIGTSGYAFAQCGTNLPGMYADYVYKGIPVDKNCRVEKTDVVFVNEKELLDAYIDGNLEKTDMDEIMNETDIHFIDNPDDPRAYKHFKKKNRLAALERKKNTGQ